MHRFDKSVLDTINNTYLPEVLKKYDDKLVALKSLSPELPKDKAKIRRQIIKYTEKKEEVINYSLKIKEISEKNTDLDLDDGVTRNYEKFKSLLGEIK